MLNKGILFGLVVLSLSSQCWSRGFYAGLGVGPEYADFKQGAHVVHPTDVDVKDTTHLSATGVFGSIFAGYRWNNKRYYLAGEVAGNASSAEFSSSNYEYVHKSFTNTAYKIDNSFSVSVLPGLVLNATTFFYTRVGYITGNFKTHTQDTSLANVDKYLSGFLIGFGVQNDISEKLAVRFEYSQANYQKTAFNVLDGTTTKVTNISPQTGKMEFGFVYKFA